MAKRKRTTKETKKPAKKFRTTPRAPLPQEENRPSNNGSSPRRTRGNTRRLGLTLEQALENPERALRSRRVQRTRAAPSPDTFSAPNVNLRPIPTPSTPTRPTNQHRSIFASPPRRSPLQLVRNAASSPFASPAASRTRSARSTSAPPLSSDPIEEPIPPEEPISPSSPSARNLQSLPPELLLNIAGRLNGNDRTNLTYVCKKLSKDAYDGPVNEDGSYKTSLYLSLSAWNHRKILAITQWPSYLKRIETVELNMAVQSRDSEPRIFINHNASGGFFRLIKTKLPDAFPGYVLRPGIPDFIQGLPNIQALVDAVVEQESLIYDGQYFEDLAILLERLLRLRKLILKCPLMAGYQRLGQPGEYYRSRFLRAYPRVVLDQWLTEDDLTIDERLSGQAGYSVMKALSQVTSYDLLRHFVMDGRILGPAPAWSQLSQRKLTPYFHQMQNVNEVELDSRALDGGYSGRQTSHLFAGVRLPFLRRLKLTKYILDRGDGWKDFLRSCRKSLKILEFGEWHFEGSVTTEPLLLLRFLERETDLEICRLGLAHHMVVSDIEYSIDSTAITDFMTGGLEVPDLNSATHTIWIPAAHLYPYLVCGRATTDSAFDRMYARVDWRLVTWQEVYMWKNLPWQEL